VVDGSGELRQGFGFADFEDERISGDEGTGPGVQWPGPKRLDPTVEVFSHLADVGLAEPGGDAKSWKDFKEDHAVAVSYHHATHINPELVHHAADVGGK
jgi:hypothetical protein